MNSNIDSNVIGNIFTERQSLIISRNKPNFFKKVLTPFAEFILENDDTSGYKFFKSALTTKIYKYYYSNKGEISARHKEFWKNASSLPRILPIAYFNETNRVLHIKLGKLANANYEDKISCKLFLLLWILRFQGSEFSDVGILTQSSIKSIIDSCIGGKYKELINQRKIKPGILALDMLNRISKLGVPSITDKQYRHARKLKNQEDEDALDELATMMIAGELEDPSQENQVFNVLQYLGLCKTTIHETNNYKYNITNLGKEVITKINSSPFVYINKNQSSSDFINYYHGMPNKFEKEIINHFSKNGGNLIDN